MNSYVDGIPNLQSSFMSKHTSASAVSKHQVGISDHVSFADSTGVIVSYLTVKELVCFRVNQSWYQLLTLENENNHYSYSIEYYSECIFNTMIKMKNPLFTELFPAHIVLQNAIIG